MKDFIHGAKWWKFDFHTHSPASMDYGKGDTSLKSITPREWLLNFMKAGIDCVSITDHNSGEWIDALKIALAELTREKPEGYQPLFLFPGVEISVSGNTHLLAIFDPSANTAKITSLLGAVKFQADKFGTSDAVTSISLAEVLEEVNKAGGIAIPAHVDKVCGLFENLTGNTLIQALQVDGLLAIEVVEQSFVKPECYIQQKLHLAEIIGSDSHTPQHVGQKYTWVKMDNPSLEALKLALHDGEDGVQRSDKTIVDPNLIQNRYFVKSISIKDGFKIGMSKTLSVKFSPWLSSIIGGRGSGKSSIINFLRIGLNRGTEMPHEIQRDFDEFNRIGGRNSVGMLRNDTEIIIEVFKQGQLYQIKWFSNEYWYSVYDSVISSWSTPIIVTNIAELFPVQIFSQKELYSLTNNPTKLLELIDSQFDKQTWLDQKNLLVEKWLSLRARQRQLKSLISDEANIKTELESVNSRLTMYESSSYKDTLSNFNKYKSLEKNLGDSASSISKFISDFNTLGMEIPVTDVLNNVKESLDAETTSFVDTMQKALEISQQKIVEIQQILEPYSKELKDVIFQLPWRAEYNKSKEEYDLIVHKISELGTDSYESLIQRKHFLLEKLEAINKNKEALDPIIKEVTTLLKTIIDKEQELRSLRQTVVDKWHLADDDEYKPFLIVELHVLADGHKSNTSFRSLIRRPGDDFLRYVFDEDSQDGIINEVISVDANSRWTKRQEVIKRLLTATENERNGFDVRFIRHIQSLKNNTPEDIDRLLLWVPEDKIVLKFRKNGKPVDIQSGSAGERVAGMLGLLLELNDIPLIIDQPEDDLDTRLISNFVVPGFRNLKKTRQLILVTHNSNIAVNSNSENVVHMDFSVGQIIVDGNNALQDLKIRNVVCEVMEGGRDALNKRYYRISKALK